MAKFKYIKTAKSAEKTTTNILVREKPIIGVKCHGVNLGPKGTITLVSIVTWEGDIYVFDVKVCPEVMYTGGLSRLLQSVELLKVFHDCSRDSATLFHQFGVRIVNFFDTQIAYSVIMENRSLCPRRVSLQHLCRELKVPLFTPSPDFQRQLSEDPNVWARRPCPTDLLTTAASEVIPLIPELYQRTSSDIPEKSSSWFIHLSEENRLSMIKDRPGRKSSTSCPKNRQQTKSLHLVPYPEPLHFCL